MREVNVMNKEISGEEEKDFVMYEGEEDQESWIDYVNEIYLKHESKLLALFNIPEEEAKLALIPEQVASDAHSSGKSTCHHL